MNKSQLLTECEVCLDEMVEPRTLPCGHTYCKTCLQQLIDGANNIRCPSDRKLFTVPEGNVDNLMRNYKLENFLENARTNRTPTVATVTCAEHADKSAEVFCERCLKSVCSICMLKHKRHPLSEYSESRNKCAQRIQQLQADVSQLKQAVDNANTAKTSAVAAQVAACKRKVDAAVKKIREIVQVLNVTADVLQSKTVQCEQLIQGAFKLADLGSLQQEVAALSKAASSFTDTDNCKLEARFKQVDELTHNLQVQRDKLESVTSLSSVPVVSTLFSDNELTRGLETVLNYAMKLKQSVTSDTNDYLSLQQLKMALNDANTAVQTSTLTSSTPRAALLQSYSQKPSQPPAVQLAAAAASNAAVRAPTQPKQILVLAGGYDNNDALAYDTSSDTWATVASMSCERGGTAATLWQGKVVVAGGYNGTNKYLKTVEQFEPESNSWTALPDMLHGRCGLALACLDNTLYAIGGKDGSTSILASVERFDSNTKRWQLTAPLNEKRGYLCCAVLGEKLLAIGGSYGSKRLESCEMLDGATQTWQVAASLQTARSSASAATVDEKVYVFGGYGKDYKELDSVEEYAAGKWTLLPVQLSVARYRLAAATVDGRVYVCGGEPEGRAVDCFDASKRQMSPVAKLPKDFSGAAAASVAVSDKPWSRLFRLVQD